MTTAHCNNSDLSIAPWHQRYHTNSSAQLVSLATYLRYLGVGALKQLWKERYSSQDTRMTITIDFSGYRTLRW